MAVVPMVPKTSALKLSVKNVATPGCLPFIYFGGHFKKIGRHRRCFEKKRNNIKTLRFRCHFKKIGITKFLLEL